MESWNNKDTRDLIEVIVSLNTYDEAKKFLRDLLTENELIEFGKRWKAATMLYEEVPYTAIESETGLSSTTIARISKWLHHGKGGYLSMLTKQSGRQK